MTEDYCSFELSKLLKEKGFDGWCEHYIFENYEGYRSEGIGNPTDWNKYGGHTSIPSLALAMKWLREKHKLFIDISFQKDEDDLVTWFYMTWALDDRKRDVEEVDFTSYEEAVEAALKYTLENLI